jgi:aminopeptidase YwaD
MSILRGAVIAVVVLVFAASPSSVAGQDATLFSGAAAKQQVDVLAGQIGSRPAGSIAYHQAVGYVETQLQQWGYAPTQQTFPITVFDDLGSSVEVFAGQGASIHLAADTLQYSIGGQIQATLVAVGLGQLEDFAGVDARGKIVLVRRGALRFADKVANATSAGALGVIVYNDGPGRVQGSLVEPSSVPAVTVSGEDGEQLLSLLAAGQLIADLTVEAKTEHRSGTNVIAELPGSRPGAGTVIFTAHLDSVAAGPGANDNGSGSGVVLELAHELAQRSAGERPLTLRFALFGAEELGLDGSQYYVQHLSEADRLALRADVNLDMVGVGDAWRFGGSEDLIQLALGAANDLGERALPLRGPLSGASDHASFLNAGVPAVFLYRVEDPNYHSAGDTAPLVDPDALRQAGTIALKVLDGVAAE